MVRSLSKRGMPKPVAIAMAFALAIFFVPFTAASAFAGEPTLTLEGCRGSVDSYEPTGPFVCPDDQYTPGAVGSNPALMRSGLPRASFFMSSLSTSTSCVPRTSSAI